MDLATNFMGLELKSPIIVSSSPLTRNGEMMVSAVKNGAGAVVTQTITSEVRPNVRPRIAVRDDKMHNIELYSELSLEQWEKEIKYAKTHGATVIANIMAHSPSEMAYLAKAVESFGADAVELGFSCPHGEGIELICSKYELIYQFTKSVKEKVSIPVMVKLNTNVTNIVNVALAAEKGGADAISGIDSVRALAGVDINTGRPLLPTFGGYSGPGIKPIALAITAIIAQTVTIPVSGIGGIINAHDVIEYIMMGAKTVQMCTGLMWHGFGLIEQIINDLRQWLTARNYHNLSEIQGLSLKYLKSFEEMKIEPYIAYHHLDKCNSCKKCIKVCSFGAISNHKNHVAVNPELCSGCGLCVGLCPQQAISMHWKDE